jgi:glycosyltransferase involved in cell wall biosynthesis
MKILFISSTFYPSIGGIQTFSQYLIKYLIKKKNNVILITNTKMNKNEKKKFNYQIFDKPNQKKINKLHDWANIIFHNHLSIRLSSIKFRHFKKTIITTQYWLGDRFSLIKFFKRIFLILCSQRIFISKAIMDHVNLNGKIFFNFYNEKIFFKIKPFTKRKKQIIFVGRMTDEKGVEILLKAITEIKNLLKINEVTFIGSGDELKSYIILSKELKVFKYINFINRSHKSLRGYFNNHKIHVVPSKKEPFGIVALEGNASGCISILSNNYGLAEFDKKTFQFFESNDYISLSRTLIKNIKKPSIPKNVNRKNNLSKYQLSHIGKKYLSIFYNVMEKNNV